MTDLRDSAPSRPRLLTVGAYERDNFGDLLFLLLTERYLTDFDVVAGAPFAADMTELLDRHVAPLGEELVERDVDVIWTVGGQVGASRLTSALRMAKSPEEYEAYLDASRAERRTLMRDALHGAPVLSPYIPTPGAFLRNSGAVSVLNSVGIAGAAGLPPHVQEEVVEALQSADVVSVRDRESSAFLDSVGVRHTTAPDVVHALGVLEPYDPDPTSDIAVVQASTKLLNRFSHDLFARRLVGSPHLAGLRFRLVMAGVAANHDSEEDLTRLAERIRAHDPGREVEVLTERRPLDIVHQIREARIVIGTSLHVRIVAAAYGLPRITLRRIKPTRYARHWDPLMPFGVRMTELDAAIAAALAAGERAEVRAASDELSRLADANARSIVDRVSELVASRTTGGREQVGADRRRRYQAIAARREACAGEKDALRAELAAVRRELDAARAEGRRLRLTLPMARRQG